MTPRRWIAGTLAPLTLVAFVSGARAAPTEPIHLERLVPDRTLAFASLEDIGSWSARAKDTALARMAAEPEMKAFMGPLEEAGRKMLEGGGPKGKGFPFPPLVLEAFRQLQGLHGQASVALVDFAEGTGPVVAGCLDFGDHLADFTTFLTRVGKEAGKDGPPIATEEKEGRTWWHLGGGDKGKPMVSATTVGTAFLVSTDPTWLAAAAASSGAAVPHSLGESDAFRASRQSAGGQALAVIVHANVPAILERVKMPDDARRIADAVGLDTVRSASYGIALKGDGFLESFVVDAPKADHGLVPLLSMRPTSHRSLALAPSTAFYYSEHTLGVSSLLPKIRQIAGRIEPDASSEIDKALQEVKGRIGMDLETDLLAGLADESVVWLGLPETGGLYPELAVLLTVKDPKAFEATMERAVNGIASVLGQEEKVSAVQRTIEYRGQRLHLLDLASTRRKVVPFTPTWTLLGDRLVVTLVPHAMKEIVLRSQMGTEGSGGLAAQEDVRALLAAGPEGHGAFGYLDLQAIMALLYDTGVPLLQTAAKPNLMKDMPFTLDWAQLPPTRTMRPYFRSLASFGSADEKGVRFAIHTPLPIVVPLAVAGVVAASVLKRKLGAIASRSVEVTLDVAMMETMSAVQLYLVENDKLPESLEALTKPGKRSGTPYLAAVPKDRWGREMDLVPLEGSGGHGFSIRSAGPDGVWGTEDDLVQSSGGTGK